MLDKKKQKEFKVSFRKATKDDFNRMIEIIGNYYQNLNLQNSHNKKNMSPWIWINEVNVSFDLMLLNGEIAGFYISRQVPLNIHLHSFFIDKKFRGIGFGKKLLINHWENGLNKSFNNDTFTLHVHNVNKFAASFYKKFGYIKIEQNDNLLNLKNGLGSWSRNCKSKDQWPLKRGIDLYLLKVKKVKKILKNFNSL